MTAPPDLVGYRFVELIGSGGYADVFLYEQEWPRQRVAVKVVRPDVPLTDREKAMSTFFKALGGFGRTYGTTMNANVQKSIFFAKTRKYPSSLEAALEDRPQDVARGLADCWTQVHRTRPQMLCVEQGYVSPGGVEAGRRGRHDLVDDLMEIVILRGGQLAIVDDGDLDGHGRVALVSRPSSGRAR